MTPDEEMIPSEELIKEVKALRLPSYGKGFGDVAPSHVLSLLNAFIKDHFEDRKYLPQGDSKDSRYLRAWKDLDVLALIVEEVENGLVYVTKLSSLKVKFPLTHQSYAIRKLLTLYDLLVTNEFFSDFKRSKQSEDGWVTVELLKCIQLILMGCHDEWGDRRVLNNFIESNPLSFPWQDD